MARDFDTPHACPQAVLDLLDQWAPRFITLCAQRTVPVVAVVSELAGFLVAYETRGARIISAPDDRHTPSRKEPVT